MFSNFLKILLILTCSKSSAAPLNENFKFHLNSEPKSLDPAEVSMGDGVGYFFQNIYRGLYVYKKSGLELAGAKSCQFKKLSLICELNPEFKWSDGKSVEASEYVLAFRHLLHFKSKNSAIRILKNLKNSSAVFNGLKDETSLGVEAMTPLKLEFKFEDEDPEFLYKLASPLAAPIRNEAFPKIENAQELLVTGPYRIESWQPHKKILLIENSFYLKAKLNKPKVEIIFVDDDQTALNLYDSHQINFLKSLPTVLIPKLKDHDDFVQVPMVRFDYIGFSPEIQKNPELRKALALSLNFSELQKMFSALGVPGCSSLPIEYSGKPVCIRFNLEEAKKAFALLPQSIKAKRYQISFSNFHSDDVNRGIQWAAEQWRTHLGLHIDIEKLESGVFNQRLKSSVPDLFRKSVLVDRPTCLSAVENFASTGSEAFLQLKDLNLERIILGWTKASPSSSLQKNQKLCRQALKELIEAYRVIGLGRIHFAMLISPQFTGWEINDLNELDLSQLELRKTSEKVK
jgi:oligopeptide transport system substrate-binding protein